MDKEKLFKLIIELWPHVVIAGLLAMLVVVSLMERAATDGRAQLCQAHCQDKYDTTYKGFESTATQPCICYYDQPYAPGNLSDLLNWTVQIKN